MQTNERGKASLYEVRCARCDVSFPLATKTCFHCGGATSSPGVATVIEPAILTASGEVLSVDPLEPDAESPFSLGESGFGDADVGSDESDRVLDQEDEAPSFVRSIVRSLGGVIWIVLLIAFSLARSCGE